MRNSIIHLALEHNSKSSKLIVANTCHQLIIPRILQRPHHPIPLANAPDPPSAAWSSGVCSSAPSRSGSALAFSSSCTWLGSGGPFSQSMRGREHSHCSQILFGGDWMDGWQRVFSSQVLGVAKELRLLHRKSLVASQYAGQPSIRCPRLLLHTNQRRITSLPTRSY